MNMNIVIDPKLRTKIQEMVSKEVKKHLNEAKYDELLDSFSEDEKKEFGKWMKREGSKRVTSTDIPSEISDGEVIKYIEQNSNEFKLSPVEYIEQFLRRNQISKSLGSAETEVDDDLDAIAAAKDAGEVVTAKKRGRPSTKNTDEEDDGCGKSGDVPLHEIAAILGVTTEGARQIVRKACEVLKIRVAHINEDPEEFAEIIDEALDKYVLLLQKVGEMDAEGGEDGDSAAAIFSDLFVAERISSVEPSDNEKIIIQHLAELAADGETGHVESLVLKDFSKKSSVLMTFQDFIARNMKKRDVDLGLVKKRGRPPGSTKKTETDED